MKYWSNISTWLKAQLQLPSDATDAEIDQAVADAPLFDNAIAERNAALESFKQAVEENKTLTAQIETLNAEIKTLSARSMPSVAGATETPPLHQPRRRAYHQTSLNSHINFDN